MNQLQHYLLTFIDNKFINIEEYIPFDKIIAELTPVYKQQNLLLDQTQINTALARIVDSGYLESTKRNFRITVRGLIYARSYPIITELMNVQIEELNKRYQSSILYLRLGVIAAIILSLIALFAR